MSLTHSALGRLHRTGAGNSVWHVTERDIPGMGDGKICGHNADNTVARACTCLLSVVVRGATKTTGVVGATDCIRAKRQRRVGPSTNAFFGPAARNFNPSRLACCRLRLAVAVDWVPAVVVWSWSVMVASVGATATAAGTLPSTAAVWLASDNTPASFVSMTASGPLISMVCCWTLTAPLVACGCSTSTTATAAGAAATHATLRRGIQCPRASVRSSFPCKTLSVVRVCTSVPSWRTIPSVVRVVLLLRFHAGVGVATTAGCAV